MSKRTISSGGATITLVGHTIPTGKQSTSYILSLWKKKLTKAEIAACTGLKPSTVDERIRHHRLINGTFTPRVNQVAPLTADGRREWRKLWAGSYTIREIADVVGQSIVGVEKRIAKLRRDHPTWFPKRGEAAA